MNLFKNLFSSSKPSVKSLKIDIKGWQEQGRTPEKITWEMEDYPAILTLNFYNIPPDLPTQPENTEELRSFYRSLVSQRKGGIIEVSPVLIESIPGIKTIFKFPLEPTGMVYIGSLTLPFKNCSYVVKIQAHEGEITGMREAVMADKLMREGAIVLGENGAEGWFRDPYDLEAKEGTLMNLSEKEEYDSLFAEHPLSFVRLNLKAMQKNMHLQEELLKIEKF